MRRLHLFLVLWGRKPWVMKHEAKIKNFYPPFLPTASFDLPIHYNFTVGSDFRDPFSYLVSTFFLYVFLSFICH